MINDDDMCTEFSVFSKYNEFLIPKHQHFMRMSIFVFLILGKKIQKKKSDSKIFDMKSMNSKEYSPKKLISVDNFQ